MKSRLVNVVLGSLVVASLASNGYLFVRWRSGLASQGAAATARDAETASRRGWNHRPVRLDGCGLRAAELQTEIAALVRLREQHLPAGLRWEQAPLNEPLTATLQAQLGKHLLAGTSAVRAECRESLCRIFPAADQHDVVARFMRSDWRNQHLRELETDDTGVLLREVQPDTVPGNELLQAALNDFESSGTIEKCQASFKGEGTLDARLGLVADGTPDHPVKVTVSTSGTLAVTPLGRCIDNELRTAMAALTLPAKVEPAIADAQFPRP